MSEGPVLKLVDVKISKNSLAFSYALNQTKFTTMVHHHNVDLEKLSAQYDPDFLQAIFVQTAVLTGIKFCSLVPKSYDIQEFSEYLTPEFLDLFKILYQKIFAQHRYENDIPNYQGPEFLVNQETIGSKIQKNEIKEGPTKILMGCGGGKDSLVSMRLLERANQEYSTFAYSHSIYGDEDHQHQIIGSLTDISKAKEKYTLSIEDDFFEKCIAEEWGVKTLLDAETPSSIFQILPLMLQHGQNYLTLGHERSADEGNFYWEEVADEVNHQWGKSYEAEKLLNDYVQTNLVPNFNFFSILKPIYDYRIFQLLAKDQDLIEHTSSCNVKKPWCKRCPKCAYVWLGYLAYLDTDKVNAIFQENPFDVPELEDTFLEMMGLKGHKPFECIGEIGETRLALKACKDKGLSGKIIDIFAKEIEAKEDFGKLLAKYDKVYLEDQNIPEFLSDLLWH
jgi:UDP-N-acetyl-alpha-D-muramoyl-L-alanyl-L-glutamate epimerase